MAMEQSSRWCKTFEGFLLFNHPSISTVNHLLLKDLMSGRDKISELCFSFTESLAYFLEDGWLQAFPGEVSKRHVSSELFGHSLAH